MDFDALKDQWSEVEDRDGIRLSWNTFPSTRMVSAPRNLFDTAHTISGSFAARCPDRCTVHTAEGETGFNSTAIRACHMQASLPCRAQPLCVSSLGWACSSR